MFYIKEVADFDVFFYYGKGDIELENQHDIMSVVFQDKRSMFYNRKFGAGVTSYENAPNSLSLTVGLRYEIALAVARRNATVTDGTSGYKDRRVAVSQNTIQFEQSMGGEMNIKILYIPLANFERPQSVSLPIGAGSL